MKNINELNEIETIEVLETVVDHIEKSQWYHLYLNLEIVEHLNEKIIKLKDELFNYKKSIKKIEEICNEL